MFCVNCGRAIKPGNHFCSNCGHELEGVPQHKKKSKTKPFWFLAILLVALLGGSYSFFHLVTGTKVNPTVEEHLKAIRKKQITEAYYEFTSRQFQSTTPLSSFRDFVQKHPQVVDNQAFKMISEKVEGNRGFVRATLLSDKGEALDLEYRLIKEGDKWKILSIEVIEKKEGNPLDVQEIRSLVDSHIKSVKEGELIAAYYNLHAKEFQKHTPLSAFEEFIHYLPLLQTHVAKDVDAVQLQNGLAKVRVVFFEGDKRAHLEYMLRREGEEWKITDIAVAAKSVKGFEKPEDVVHEQLRAIREQELPLAYFEFFSEEYQKTTPYKDFVKFVKLHAPLGENKRAEFAKPLNLGKVATLKGTIYSLQNEKALIEYELVQEDGEWKILGVEVITNAYHQ